MIGKRSLVSLILILSSFHFGYSIITKPSREFRGVWMATVSNIDFPRSTKTDITKQKQELINYLTVFEKNNINAVVFQVRPCADAFYKSNYENWSKWLVGKDGREPQEEFDPLAFIIKEGKKRNIEIHAWLNPYRALLNYKKNFVSKNHITKQHPEWFVNYGKQKLFNPALAEVQQYICKIVEDITKRYDIAAIHMDDYFYPYRIYGKEFPDTAQYRINPRGFTNIDDWRRDNVNQVVKKIKATIRKVKPEVRFGISPFGVWRNKRSDDKGSVTFAGQTNYDDLYADILHWIDNGYIDYVAPQLYWERGNRTMNYNELQNWWSRYTKEVDLYIGLGTFKLKKNARKRVWRKTHEIQSQIEMGRKEPKIKGSIHFSSKYFLQNTLGISDTLQQNQYKYKALIPEYKTKDSLVVKTPEEFQLKGDTLSWNEVDKAKYYLVYKSKMARDSILTSRNLINICPENFCVIDTTEQFMMYYITAVDKFHRESPIE